MNKVVFAVSGKARHGKDTAADIIESYLGNYSEYIHRIAYADELKKIAYSLGWDGQKDEAGRTYLQNLSEPIKVYNGLDYFSNIVIDDIIAESPKYSIITDVRFIFEAQGLEKLKDYGFHVVFIRVSRVDDGTWESPLTIEQQNHESEIGLDYFVGNVEMIKVVNDNLDDFTKRVEDIVINNI